MYDEPPTRLLGIRRWGDSCFHAVEEEVPEGYIIDGILIQREDVEEVRVIDPNDKPAVRVLKTSKNGVMKPSDGNRGDSACGDRPS